MKIADTYSGTFGCPNTRATASQPKEPSFCRRSRMLIINEKLIRKEFLVKTKFIIFIILI